MKIYENIEKVYRVKGYTCTFETPQEAKKFVEGKLLKEHMDDVRNYKKQINILKETTKKVMAFKQETFCDDKELSKKWRIVSQYEKIRLVSESANYEINMPFQIDLRSKKDLNFAREVVRNYSRNFFNVFAGHLRGYKNALKNAQRKYSELKELIK